jgi:CBS domain containing-hemolysin-like protein
MASAGPKTEGDSSGRIWRYLKGFLFGENSEPSLREQIEEVIDEAGDEHDAATGDGHGTDLSAIEREMLRNMLHFGEQTVDDVAVPRGDIVAINDQASFEEAVALFADADHSRLPVYREKLDDVVGMLHVKDVFGVLARGEQPPASLNALLRQPLYVPQSMSAMELLAEMRAKRTHLAIVLDEYGGTDGLVTIEDLMEEIVGEIEDEHDDAPEEMVIERDGFWDADARVELEDLAERIDPRLTDVDEDVDTLGGLAFVLAEKVPAAGEVLLHPESGWRLEILDGDERRVTRVRLHPPLPETPGTEGD